MRKIRNLFTILICCIVTLFDTPIVSCAKGLGEIDFDCSEIPVLEPWVSYTFELSHYDPTKFTETTEVIIEYTFEPTVGDSEGLTIEDVKDECPLELIVQSWSDPDTPMVNATGGVWAKVAPYEWGDGYAKFSIDDMIAAYGTSDFSKVDALNVGATGYSLLTVKSCKVTDVKEGVYLEMTDAERAEMYKNALIIVLASALAIITVIIIVFVVILKRKSSMAYDPNTGKYIKIKK